MNLERTNRGTAAGIGFIIAGAIFAALSTGMKVGHAVPMIDADRAAVRAKALADMRAAEETALNTPAVIDAAHGTVRLPIETAMQMAAQAWQNPAAARADLESRAENAAKELPKAPPKPNPFE